MAGLQQEMIFPRTMQPLSNTSADALDKLQKRLPIAAYAKRSGLIFRTAEYWGDHLMGSWQHRGLRAALFPVETSTVTSRR